MVHKFLRYGWKPYPKIMEICPWMPEKWMKNLSKNHENWSMNAWDMDVKHIQESWESLHEFLRCGWKTYPKIMKIGPWIPKIWMKNISKNYENWFMDSWHMDENHIQKSWKLVHGLLRYGWKTYPKIMKIGPWIPKIWMKTISKNHEYWSMNS